MLEKRKRAAEILIAQFKKFINKIEAKYADNPNFAAEIQLLKQMTDELFSFTMTPQNMLKYLNVVSKYIRMEDAKPSTLLLVSEFFCKVPSTGFNPINNIL